MIGSSQKLILCITNQSLTAGLWHGSKLQSHQVFENHDEDYTAFSVYLSKHKDIDVYLMVDAIEEDYKLEALPHTTGNARKEIVARKLAQFNRNSIYRAAHFINRDKNKRKDDNFLFVALSNSDFMQGWMDAIQAEKMPLVGVYLLPMVSQVIVRQMKLMSPHILLCEHLSSGLRQTYLHNGRLRMSRLTPMTNVKQAQLSYFYLVEIEKTRLYLLSQRLIAAGTPLQIVLPAIDEPSDDIAKSVSQDQGIECKTVDILTFAKNSNISQDVVKLHPELLHMQLLANGNIPDNLAPAELTKTHNIKNLCRNINLVTILVLMVGVITSGIYFFQAYQTNLKIEETAAKKQQQLQQYELVAQNYPETPLPGTDLKAAVEIAAAINQETPKAMMLVISAALKEAPEIAIDRIRWVQTDQLDIKDGNENASASSNTQQVSGSSESVLRQIGFINAEIRYFKGDYRAALASASRFANLLRENQLVEQVKILQEPVNVSSFANLQGSTRDENTAQRTPAIFKLKVVLKSQESESLK
ncbi:MAG TPA: hypothetical protein VLM20_05730 [Methylophilaceae bacterium]|nr:hypothetical protein [Methylophilaceae bacterium]